MFTAGATIHRRLVMADSGAPPELTADDLHALVRQLGLVPIPERLVGRVLAAVRHQRASMRRLDEAGIELADVVTAQVYRADESGGAR
jgi:hypothetical protein